MKPTPAQLYRDRRRQQTIDWCNNVVYHNKTDNECTPDFGCCNPTLLAPIEERNKFFEAYKANKQHIVNPMLNTWMDKLKEYKGIKTGINQIKK